VLRIKPVAGETRSEISERKVLRCGEKRREVWIVKGSLVKVDDIVKCELQVESSNE
jgi:hypothetical protein